MRRGLHERHHPRRHPGGRPVGALAGQDGPSRRLQGQGGDQGEAREVPHRQVRPPPDEPHQEEAGGGDVAVRGAQEALREQIHSKSHILIFF